MSLCSDVTAEGDFVTGLEKEEPKDSIKAGSSVALIFPKKEDTSLDPHYQQRTGEYDRLKGEVPSTVLSERPEYIPYQTDQTAPSVPVYPMTKPSGVVKDRTRRSSMLICVRSHDRADRYVYFSGHIFCLLDMGSRNLDDTLHALVAPSSNTDGGIDGVEGSKELTELVNDLILAPPMPGM
jgi:hypothetical protein